MRRREQARGLVAVATLLAAAFALGQNAVNQTGAAQIGANQNGVNPADPNPGYTPTENRLMSKVTPVRPSPADVALSAYIARVHANYEPEEPAPGVLVDSERANDRADRGLPRPPPA